MNGHEIDLFIKKIRPPDLKNFGELDAKQVIFFMWPYVYAHKWLEHLASATSDIRMSEIWSEHASF